MRPRLLRTGLWLAGIAGLVVVAWLGWGLLSPAGAPARPEPPPVAAPAPPDPGLVDPALEPGGGEPPLELTIRDSSIPWGSVDLAEVRKALPHNLYWQLAEPTEDVRVQQQREDDRASWNVQYGKMLSGTGTEQEIQAYFEHRQRLSADYVEFVSYVLDHYGDKIPERDVGLLELARRLHLARLEEIPRKTQEAFERKRAQDEARAAWLADEAAFDPAAKRD